MLKDSTCVHVPCDCGVLMSKKANEDKCNRQWNEKLDFKIGRELVPFAHRESIRLMKVVMQNIQQTNEYHCGNKTRGVGNCE